MADNPNESGAGNQKNIPTESENNTYTRPTGSGEDFASAARDQLADMNRKLEDQGATDSNTGRINRDLHGESSDMINRYVDKLGSADRNDLPSLLQGPNDYTKYKNEIQNRVLDKDGRIKDDATIEDMRKLLDLNNAEVSAMDDRRGPATKNLNKAETMKQFDSQGQVTRPKDIGNFDRAKPKPPSGTDDQASSKLETPGQKTSGSSAPDTRKNDPSPKLNDRPKPLLDAGTPEKKYR